MSKQYGLIVKKKSTDPPGRSNFEATRVNRESKLAIDKALEEDPNIFAYDEIYDDMKKSQQPESSEKRKITEERRQDKKIEKEREQEGDEFRDKEVFVTEAYRQKLLERKIHEEREKIEQELEDQMDPTKLREHGMSAFYRNFINQKVGERVETNLKEKYLDKMTKDLRNQLLNENENQIRSTDEKADFKKSSKSVHSKRQRQSSGSSEEDNVVIQRLRKGKERERYDERSERRSKKKDDKKEGDRKEMDKIEEDKSKKNDQKVEKENDLNNKNEAKENNEKIDNKVEREPIDETPPIDLTPRLSLREILTDLFTKRCVDNEYLEAQRRYFERKANH